MNITAQIEALGLNAYIAKKHHDKIEYIEIGSDNRVYIQLAHGYNNGNDGLVILCNRSELRYWFKQVREGVAHSHLEEVYAEIEAENQASQAEREEHDELMAELDLQDAKNDEELEAQFEAVEAHFEEIRKTKEEINEMVQLSRDFTDAELIEIMEKFEDAQIVFYSIGLKYSDAKDYDFTYKGLGISERQCFEMVVGTILRLTFNYLIASREIIKYI